jgi:hypothetical protein
MIAAWPPRPRATCRSTALVDMFVSPPLNQRNVGGVQSSTESHRRDHGRVSASRAQKASGSASASSRARRTIGLTISMGVPWLVARAGSRAGRGIL